MKEVKILVLGKDDFDSRGYYIGNVDLSDYVGDVVIDYNSRIVKFDRLNIFGNLKSNGGIKTASIAVTGDMLALMVITNHDIIIGGSLQVFGIRSGGTVKVGGDITSGSNIDCNNLFCDGNIHSVVIKSRGYIISNGNITLRGVIGGNYIKCCGDLNVDENIFAGITPHEHLRDKNKTIYCGKLINGDVCYGILKEGTVPKSKYDSLRSANRFGCDIII